MIKSIKDELKKNRLKISIEDEKGQKQTKLFRKIRIYIPIILSIIYLTSIFMNYRLVNSHKDYEDILEEYIVYQKDIIDNLEANLYFVVQDNTYTQLYDDGSRLYANLPEYFNNSWSNLSNNITNIKILYPDCLREDLCFVVYKDDYVMEVIQK